MLSLNAVISLLLYCTAVHTYDIFLSSCIDVSKLELTVFPYHTNPSKPFLFPAKHFEKKKRTVLIGAWKKNNQPTPVEFPDLKNYYLEIN